MITVSIDLTAIKESGKVTKSEKNGHSYINIVVDERKQPDNYGNTHTVYISQSKEEREAKKEKKYCGNGKEYKFNQQQTPHPEPQQQSQSNNCASIDEDPF